MNTIVSTISKAILGGPVNNLLIKKINGWENIPKGGFILAANHLSHADWFVCGYICAPNKFAFIGQVDRYNSGFNGLWRRLIYWWGSTIPIDRNSDESKRRAIATAIKMLKRGYRIIIYPEGGRAYDGVMREFKSGVAKLHLDSGLPVLPVAIKNTQQILPPHGKISFKKVAEINIGKPLVFEKEIKRAQELDHGSQEYRGLCADIAKKIENEVRKLLNQNGN